MNKELLEKLSAIREDLLALKALVPVDAKIVVENDKFVLVQPNPHIQKLVELLKQKTPTMWDNYRELFPYMTTYQRSRVSWASGLAGAADYYLRTGKDHLTGLVEKGVRLLLADLDDIAKNLNKQ